ncbi:hypothetical protein Nmel_004265 [Mimus melanotis]
MYFLLVNIKEIRVFNVGILIQSSLALARFGLISFKLECYFENKIRFKGDRGAIAVANVNLADTGDKEGEGSILKVKFSCEFPALQVICVPSAMKSESGNFAEAVSSLQNVLE